MIHTTKLAVLVALLVVLGFGTGTKCEANYTTLDGISAGDFIITNPYANMPTYRFDSNPGNFQDSGGDQYGDPIIESGLIFDPASLPAGSTINGATFTITTYEQEANSVERAYLNVYEFYSSTPIVTEADFTGPTTYLGGSSLPTYAFSPITLSFNASIPPNGEYVGFLLEVTGLVYSYGIGEQNPAYAPTLGVNYTPALVPEPSSLLLCSIGGLVGAIAINRSPRKPRRRAAG
jgi:hypothetical protein